MARNAAASRELDRPSYWISFSSSSGGNPGGSSGAHEADQAAAHMMQMMEALMKDPSTQQLLLSRMPPHMRRPEVVKAMMANPEVRQRIAALAQQAGLHDIMQGAGVAAEHISSGIDATRKAGMDPGSLFGRFMSSPSLAEKLKDPRVLAALMDVVNNGPRALQKYSGDQAVVEAWMEAAELLEQHQQGQPQQEQQPHPPLQTDAPPPGMDGEGMRRAQQALGVKPEDLMSGVMSRPELMLRVRDPEVQKALTEIYAKPWKVVKYLLNSKVMRTLKEMRDVLKEARDKP